MFVQVQVSPHEKSTRWPPPSVNLLQTVVFRVVPVPEILASWKCTTSSDTSSCLPSSWSSSPWSLKALLFWGTARSNCILESVGEKNLNKIPLDFSLIPEKLTKFETEDIVQIYGECLKCDGWVLTQYLILRLTITNWSLSMIHFLFLGKPCYKCI